MSAAVMEDTSTHHSPVDEVTASEARERLGEVINRVHLTGEPIRITRRGQPVAVIIDAEIFELLVDRAEELLGLIAVEEAKAEGGDPIPWEQVEAHLGLDSDEVDQALREEVKADLGWE